MQQGELRIGTSGWMYSHWKGNFYPETLKNKDRFGFYQEHFDTVELNNPFYKLPDRETFVKWKESASGHFLFAVKANRFITHMKKLGDAKEPLRRQLHSIRGLGRKLGPLLFQLPPMWNLNAGRLADFLKLLPPRLRCAFEFRNQSWYTGEIYRLLREHNHSFCIYHLGGHLSPLELTADHVYVRLHGPGLKYQGSYTETDLRTWARRIRAWRKSGKDVYVYFDNDQSGYAAFNALRLKELLRNAAAR